MSIRLKATLSLLVALAVGAILTVRSSYASVVQAFDACEQRELRAAAAFIQSGIVEQAGRAASAASFVAGLPSVQEAFRAQDRAALLRAVGPALATQREQYGVRNAQFHLPPAIAFLRVFEPTVGHGEDLSGYRELVLSANRRQEPQRGVEIGRLGLSVRAIDLVRDARGVIGTFEVGLSFSSVLAGVRQTTGFEAGVFVDESRMRSIATMVPRPDAERVVGGLQNTDATSWQAIRPVLSTSLLAQVRDVTTRSVVTPGGARHGVVVVPLRDFRGTPIGAVVATRRFDGYQQRTRGALVSAVSVSAGQSLLLLVVLAVVLQGLLLRPILLLRERVARSAAGEAGVSLAPLTRKRDEVGELARGIEDLERAHERRVKARTGDADA